MPCGSTIPLLAPISPTVRDFSRSALARAWVPVLALSAAVAAFDRRSDAGDLLYFVHQGERLLSGRWADTFGDPTLQAGPFQLLLAGALRNMTALAFVVEVGVAALLLFVLMRLRVPPRWQLAVGVTAVAAGLTHGAFVEGHPAEAVTPLLWVLAAIEARRGRTKRAGAILGLSAGLELWGMLGVPVLLLAPRVGAAVRGLCAQVAVVAALFAPFVLLGHFAMFDYQWRVARGAPLAFVLAPGTHFGWPLRLLQATVACAGGAVLARYLRTEVHAVWAVPLLVALARIALDPLAYGWYWLEALALTLVGAALFLTAPPLRLQRARRRKAGDRPRPAAPPPPIHS